MLYGLWMQGKLPLWWTDHWHTAATFYFVNDKTVVFPVLPLVMAL